MIRWKVFFTIDISTEYRISDSFGYMRVGQRKLQEVFWNPSVRQPVMSISIRRRYSWKRVLIILVRRRLKVQKLQGWIYQYLHKNPLPFYRLRNCSCKIPARTVARQNDLFFLQFKLVRSLQKTIGNCKTIFKGCWKRVLRSLSVAETHTKKICKKSIRKGDRNNNQFEGEGENQSLWHKNRSDIC